MESKEKEKEKKQIHRIRSQTVVTRGKGCKEGALNEGSQRYKHPFRSTRGVMYSMTAVITVVWYI